MLEYSVDEKNIAGKFKKGCRDLVVYTEDNEECHLFYQTLFDRIGLFLGLKIVAQQLGTCDDVQQCCDEDDDLSFAKLYLVDGDIFLMCNPKRERANFFPLDRYCIENFLLDRKAIVELAFANNGKKSREIIEEELDYDNIMTCLAQHMLPVYCRYAVLKKVKDRNKLKGWGYFFDGENKCFLCDKIELEKLSVETEIAGEVNDARLAATLISEMEGRFPHDVTNALKYLSGKDCILSYLQSQITSKTSTNIGMNRSAVKLLLANQCDLQSFSALMNKIQQVVKNFNHEAA